MKEENAFLTFMKLFLNSEATYFSGVMYTIYGEEYKKHFYVSSSSEFWHYNLFVNEEENENSELLVSLK